MQKLMIDDNKMQAMKNRLGCTFCDNGEFAEMILDITDYREKTMLIDDTEFRFFDGEIEDLRYAVALVDKDWVQYFKESTPVFCAYKNGELVSFCIVDVEAECILETGNKKVGSIGCVGTVPRFRRLGIGLRMVDLATIYLKNKGCKLSSISYTPVENWYKKLGYLTYARFTI